MRRLIVLIVELLAIFETCVTGVALSSHVKIIDHTVKLYVLIPAVVAGCGLVLFVTLLGADWVRRGR